MSQARSGGIIRTVLTVAACKLLMAASLAVAAPPPPPSGPLQAWPCSVAPSALTPEGLLGHAVPAETGDWQTDKPVREVVDFAAAPENAPDTSRPRIEALSASSGPGRQAKLMLARDGIVARSNQLRGIVEYGVREKVEKSKLLSDTLAAAKQALAGLPQDAPADRRVALEQDRAIKGKALGDNAEDAELLCHRYEYIARKAQRLGAAIIEVADKR